MTNCSGGNRTLPHAASAMGANNAYTYDCNGNQIQRDIGSDTYDLIYNPEGQLLQVKKNSTTIATFVYDGDGRRVKSTMSGTTIIFVGNHYEVSGETITKYYYAGASRVAMRTGSSLRYLLSDHLGSTSIVTNGLGGVISENRYKAWGEVRYTSGTTPTKYTYTGQYSYTADFGLIYYNARWYDPALGRFAQADPIIQNPFYSTSYDRYSYVFNNPLRYVDPTGYLTDEEIAGLFGFKDIDSMRQAPWIIYLQEQNSDLWQAFKTAKNGDIFTFEIGDQTYRLMFILLKNGKYGFWDVENKCLFIGDSKFFEILISLIDNWALMRDDDQDKTYTQIMASSEYSSTDYTLSPGWNYGANGSSVYFKASIYGWKISLDLILIVGGVADAFFVPEVALKVVGVLAAVVGTGDMCYNIVTGGYIKDWKYVYSDTYIR